MSASILYNAYGIKGIQYKSFHKSKKGVVYEAEMACKPFSCPKCSSKTMHWKGQKMRRFKMPPIGSTKCYLDLVLHRVKCTTCGHQWWPRLSFMKGKFRMTRSFMQYALDLLGMSTIEDVAQHLGISWNVVKGLHKEKLGKLYKKIILNTVHYVSVDEFAIKKGHEYMTVFSDIESGRILYAVEGRKGEDIISFLKKLKKEAKELKAIAMDMSKAYIAAVKETLPGVDIVFDHFHVNAVMNKALDEIRKEQQSTLNNKVLKGNRFLLLKNYESLDFASKNRLDVVLLINEPLFKAHALKEQFRLFWRQGSEEEGALFLDKWLEDAKNSGIQKIGVVA